MKVSVIMPVGGEASNFVQKAVESLKNQILEDWELIIHPDSSDDIQELNRTDRIKVLEPENINLPASRNRCLDEAEGEYIAVLDSDDIARKDRLQWQANYLNQNPDIDLIGQHQATTRRISQNGEVLRPYSPESFEEFNSVKNGNPIHHSSVMFRNEGWRYREKFNNCQEFDLYLRIADDDFSNVKVVPKDLVTVRETDGSVSRKNVYNSAGYGMAAALMRIRRQKGLDENYDEWDPSDNMELIRAIRNNS